MPNGFGFARPNQRPTPDPHEFDEMVARANRLKK